MCCLPLLCDTPPPNIPPFEFGSGCLGYLALLHALGVGIHLVLQVLLLTLVCVFNC